MVRKISSAISDEQLQQDLERYRQRCIELGATDAKVIASDAVRIDERVRAKCRYPRCTDYGTNAHCPPHAMELDEVRKTVSRYQYGIFFRTVIPSTEFIGEGKEGNRLRASINAYKIVGSIESEAFSDGYYLSLGFAGGPCKVFFCPTQECSALIPGQACRHPLQARSSMEGVGMNVFSMAASAGWDVYPIGRRTSPADVPFAGRYGLVLIH
jgi:predicted metal-binding protein